MMWWMFKRNINVMVLINRNVVMRVVFLKDLILFLNVLVRFVI